MDYSLPGSSVHGVLQARILEWVAISFSRGSSQPRDHTHVSCIAFFSFYRADCVCVLDPLVMSDSVTPWTVALQAPLSVEFSRKEYRGFQGIFPTQGLNLGLLQETSGEPKSPWQADSLPLVPPGKAILALIFYYILPSIFFPCFSSSSFLK